MPSWVLPSDGEIRANGGKGFAVSLDVTSPKSTTDAFAYCEKEVGIVSVLVNNAGTAGRENSIDLTEQEWDRVLETNLNGVWRVTKEAARRMILSKTRGSIINIPRGKLAKVLKEITKLSKKYKLPVANAFHAGDGNLHPIIMFDANDKTSLEKTEKFGEDI